jgi:hypothetical protein
MKNTLIFLLFIISQFFDDCNSIWLDHMMMSIRIKCFFYLENNKKNKFEFENIFFFNLISGFRLFFSTFLKAMNCLTRLLRCLLSVLGKKSIENEVLSEKTMNLCFSAASIARFWEFQMTCCLFVFTYEADNMFTRPNSVWPHFLFF